MKRRHALIILILFALLTTGCVARVVTSGSYTLRSGETLRGDLLVFSGMARLEEDSRVTGSVIMTSGTLDVNTGAQIDGNVVMTSGDIYLEPRAIVHGDVIGTSGRVHQMEGARIEGQVSTGVSSFSLNGGFIAELIGIYCILPVLVIVAIFFILISFWRRPPVATEKEPVRLADPTQKLKQLQEMMDQGLITESDYETKKAEILSRM